MHYLRDKSGPLLAGDIIDEGAVRAFGYIAPYGSGGPSVECDRLVLAGEEGLSMPPERQVPSTAEDAKELSLSPALRPGVEAHSAAGIDADLPGRIAEMLALEGAPWSSVAGILIDRVYAEGHLLWISGGASRDVIAQAGNRVNDLDLTGTAPPGRFSQIADRIRTRLGLEYRVKVSPDSLVCSAVVPGNERLYEYRTLNVVGLRYPASGSDPVEDARTRDLTVNSVHYDPVHNIIVDASGRGLDDLLAPRRRIVSLKECGAVGEKAAVILRIVKFVLRWGEDQVDLDVLAGWMDELADGWTEHLSERDWADLSKAFARTIADSDPDLRRSAAALAGRQAVELIDELVGRAP
jgi:poly(A) polymerase